MCDRQLGESDRSTFEAAHCRLADEGWSLRPLRYADFRRLRPLHPDLLDSHLMLQLAEAELHQGNEFVGLFDGEELLGFGGISFIHFAISAEPLPPGAVYLWDDFVCPAHRGRKIHNLLITLRCEIAAERGRNRALALVHTFNKASRKNFEEEGFRRFALWLRLERKFQCVAAWQWRRPFRKHRIVKLQ